MVDNPSGAGQIGGTNCVGAFDLQRCRTIIDGLSNRAVKVHVRYLFLKDDIVRNNGFFTCR